MLERVIIGMLGSGLGSIAETTSNLPDFNETRVAADMEASSSDLLTPNRFHVGMLSISFLVTAAYAGFTAYTCWFEENILLSHIRNLVASMAWRTFFTLLIEAVIILGRSRDIAGGHTLLAFECIALNLVYAFWLTLTIYLHARVQRNFKSEPTLRLFMYGVPGVAVFFALTWIFILEGRYGSFSWWILLSSSVDQWVVDTLRLLYLLIQLGLVVDMGRMLMNKRSSFDNDSVSLIRLIAILMGVLIFFFWLRFGLSVGRPPWDNPQPYRYFYFFVDGLLGAIVCPIFYFFEKWVVLTLTKTSIKEDTNRKTSNRGGEILVNGNGDRGIFTVDSVLARRESATWKPETENAKDVIYSSVIQPEKFKKTLDLYKRFNVLHKNEVTVFGGDKFYDCNNSDGQRELDDPTKISKPERKKRIIRNVEFDKVQKKNAFYSSKYLIVDSEETDFPKYLETRPSISSVEEESVKEKNKRTFPVDSVLAKDLVKKWLNDCSDDLEGKASSRRENVEGGQKGEVVTTNTHKDDGRKEDSEVVEPEIGKDVGTEDSRDETENQNNYKIALGAFISNIQSALKIKGPTTEDDHVSIKSEKDDASPIVSTTKYDEKQELQSTTLPNATTPHENVIPLGDRVEDAYEEDKRKLEMTPSDELSNQETKEETQKPTKGDKMTETDFPDNIQDTSSRSPATTIRTILYQTEPVPALESLELPYKPLREYASSEESFVAVEPTKNRGDIIDLPSTSDSEFEIEKSKRTSTDSSGSSFSLNEYYRRLKADHAKFSPSGQKGGERGGRG